MRKPVNPKAAVATVDANLKFLETICRMGRTPNYDAGLDEEAKKVIPYDTDRAAIPRA